MAAGAEVGEVAGALDVGAAAVRHLVHQHAGRPGHVHRLEDGERGRILHHAAGVARRQRDVGDHGVERLFRIELAEEPPGQLLVGLVGVLERLPLLHRELDDLGARRHGRHASAQAANDRVRSVWPCGRCYVKRSGFAPKNPAGSARKPAFVVDDGIRPDANLPLRSLRQPGFLREHALRPVRPPAGVSARSDGDRVARSRRRARPGARRTRPRERRTYRLCANYSGAQVCNWAVDARHGETLCEACRLTTTIPDLTVEGHQAAWYKLEVAKRRLVYTLLSLRLPIVPRSRDPRGLAFEFLADAADGPPTVLTGHTGGVITISLAEADDAERERRRHALGEPYRTLLGHVRHESGHYYWDRLIAGTDRHDAFRALLRRRARRLSGGAAAPLRRRPAGRLAGAVRHRLRQRASVGGLGRDLGPLPAHHRHARDGGGLRRVDPPAAA